VLARLKMSVEFGGYEAFLSAIADPKHEQHVDLLRWIGGVFDPEGFDINAANFRIRKLKG